MWIINDFAKLEKIREDAKDAEILNTFFSNLVKNLKIPVFEEVNLFAEKAFYGLTIHGLQLY